MPDRIDFDPFPWHSMAVWILTQMKRWGYVKGDVDYKKVAEQVYLAADCGKLMKELGHDAAGSDATRPTRSWARRSIPTKPEAYLESFAIRSARETCRTRRACGRLLSLAATRLALLAPWQLATLPQAAARRGRRGVRDARGAPAPSEDRRFPRPAEVARLAARAPAPIRSTTAGPNDKGIGIQLALFARARR